MKFVAAYLLANLGGNSNPNAKDLKKILDSVGATVDEDRIEKLLEELEDKDIHTVIEEGKSKLASVPVGGAAAGGAAAPAGAVAEEVEEKKEETEEESDDDMGMDLFG